MDVESPDTTTHKTHMEQLASFDRDLTFVPVVNTRPQVLTPQQIDLYNERGVLFPVTSFDHEAAAANRAYFDALIANVQATEKDVNSIHGHHVRCRGLYDLCVAPQIVALVKDLLGPDVICWGTHYFCKLAGDEKEVSWHQDGTYWPFDKSRTVTAWLAIDDSDTQNGAMRVIPSTHRMGAFTTRVSTDGERNVLDDVVPDAQKYGEPVDLELKAGQVSLHSDMLLHGSRPNRSDRRRCGLTLRYCPPDVRALTGWNRGSIWAAGTDPSGHWANVPRPTGENP